MPSTLATKEDLNFNRIVSKQFDKAAQYLKIHPALLAQIKACNNVYYFQFPVRFGGDHYEIFEGWRDGTLHKAVPPETGRHPRQLELKTQAFLKRRLRRR